MLPREKKGIIIDKDVIIQVSENFLTFLTEGEEFIIKFDDVTWQYFQRKISQYRWRKAGKKTQDKLRRKRGRQNVQHKSAL